MQIILDGECMQERRSAHVYLKEKFGFPDYYGNNLDALHDCLTELSDTVVTVLPAKESGYWEKVLHVLEASARENTGLKLIEKQTTEEKDMDFKEVKAEELVMNPFTKIGKEWLLLTAGNGEKANTMTASWGGLGVMWGKNAATIYVRPQRYTKEFIDANDCFTISVLSESHRDALKYCGSASGKGIDKIKEAGLTAVEMDGTVGIGEADLVLVCRKMYADTIKPECFIDTEQDGKWYPQKDYHTMYIAEIVKAYVK